jgi:predicted dehydrogenase
LLPTPSRQAGRQSNHGDVPGDVRNLTAEAGNLDTSALRALIVGCGNIAGGYDLLGAKQEVWTHAKAYQLTPGVELVGAIDRSASVARQFANTWKVPYSGTDLAAALKKTKPDLVSICSPTATHVPLINELCRAGIKAIFCEKPIAYDLRAAERAVQLCERKGVVLAINYQRNWDKESNRLKDSIHQGDFGRVELIRVLYSKGLIHNGSHFVSLLNRWFGNLEIGRMLSTWACNSEDVKADFTATCPAADRIIFQNIPESTYVLNEIEVLFERGRLELRRGGLDLLWTDRHFDPLLPSDVELASKSRRLPVTLPRAMLEVMRNFIAAAKGTQPLQSSPESALGALRFCITVRTLGKKGHA